MIGEMFSAGSVWPLLLLQGTACIAVGLGASVLLHRRAARAHHALLIGMLAAVLTPGLYVAVRHFKLGLLVAEATAPEVAPRSEAGFDRASPADIVAAERPAIETTIDRPVLNVAETMSAPPPPVQATPTGVPWKTALFGGWTVVAALLLGRLLLRFLLGLRILRSAMVTESEHLHRAVEAAKTKIGLRRRVQLQSSERVHSPIVWCWSRRPVLLVQKTAEAYTAGADWVGVFCHELAHWKRLDHVSALFAELLACAVPWHPLVWSAKRRLVRLSEEACDDWAVDGKHVGVAYAESLLDLSPERQLALVPAVVGKEKVMKARISRIVTGRCNNPRIGARWTLAVSLLAVLAAAGVAFAQRRPATAERRQAQERQEQRELAMIGRRNVLHRMLEQLVAQARETEAALREGGDALGEEGHVLRSELDALRDHIEIVERQLRNLDRKPQRPTPEEGVTWPSDGGEWIPPPGEPPEVRSRRERSEELEKALALLKEERAKTADEVHQKEMDLDLRRRQAEQPGDAASEEIRQLEEELEQVSRHAHELDRQLAELGRQRAEIEIENVMQAAERARLKDEKAIEEAMAAYEKTVEEHERQRHVLEQRLQETTGHAEQLQHKLEDVGDTNAEQARIIQDALEQARKEIASVETQLRDVERERESVERDREVLYGGTPRRSRGRVSATARRRTPRYGDDIMYGYGDPTSRGRSRATRRSREAGMYDEMAGETVQQEDETVQQEADLQRRRLIQAHKGLLAEIKHTEEELHKAAGKDEDKVRRLQDVLVQLHERRLSLEQRLSQSEPEPDRPTGRRIRRDPTEDESQPVVRIYKLKHANAGQMVHIIQPLIGHLGRVEAVPDDRTNSLLVEATAAGHERIEGIIEALDVPGAVQPSPRSAQGADIETQVDELRCKVDSLHEQMQQMREMLQQIMEQTKETPPVLRDIEAPEGL